MADHVGTRKQGTGHRRESVNTGTDSRIHSFLKKMTGEGLRFVKEVSGKYVNNPFKGWTKGLKHKDYRAGGK